MNQASLPRIRHEFLASTGRAFRRAALARLLVWALPLVVSMVAISAPVEAQPPANFSAVSGLNGTQRGIAQGTDAFCDSATRAGTTLSESLCEVGFRGGLRAGLTTTSETRVGLQNLGFEETAAQGTTASNAQIATLSARLAALRGGATGISLGRVASSLDEPPRVGIQVASLSPYPVSAAIGSGTEDSLRGIGVFLNGTFGFGDKDQTGREPGFDFDSQSVTLGVDYRLTRDLILGVAFGYVASNADLKVTSLVRGGAVDSDAYSGSIYGTYYVTDQFYVDGIGTFGWTNYTSRRRIVYRFTDPSGVRRFVDQTAEGKTDGPQYALAVSGGYDFPLGPFTVGPLARVNYTRVEIDGYRERIIRKADSEALQHVVVDKQTMTSLTSSVGAQASWAISTRLGVVVPQARVEWVHEFENDSRQITARYVGDPGRTPLRIPTDAPDRDYFSLGVGVSALFARGVSAFVYYETLLGLRDVTSHTVTLGVRVEL